MTSEARPQLFALAERAGVMPGYHDIAGRYRPLTASAAEAVLAAMGFDASTEAGAERSVGAVDAERGAMLLEPVRVIRAAESDGTEWRWTLPRDHVRMSGAGPVAWHLEVHTEDGGVIHAEGRARRGSDDIKLTLPRSASIGLGYHSLRLALDVGGQQLAADQRVVVAPRRCYRPDDDPGRARFFGLHVNLYTLRGKNDWGVGDVAMLRRLGTASAARGAGFLGISPLHALRNRGDDFCPYNPVSRLFGNDIYIDVERVPEFAETPTVRAWLDWSEVRERLVRVRAAKSVDYDEVSDLKRTALRRLFETFLLRHLEVGSPRGQAYGEFLRQGGSLLRDFAAFLALGDWLGRTGQAPPYGDWRTWPVAFDSPQRPAVQAFQRDHAEDVEFVLYTQFELDRQFGETQAALRKAGMPIGLYHDLAVGSSGGGADAWMFPGLFARDVELGAPPDPYSDVGQTWGFPPLIPQRLRNSGHAYWIALLRHSFRHAGMLRIDHAIGLHRQYWVPSGRSGTDGAFVRYPMEELLGILALESQRCRAVVVGEDLGLVPPEVPAALADWGAYSMRMVHFEREGDGRYRAPKHYPANALVCVTTHDHPPLKGLWNELDLELRRRIGAIASDEELQRHRNERKGMREALVQLLREEGLLAWDQEPTLDRVLRAVHGLLVRCPAAFLGISLDDVAGETEPVNLPGVPPSQFRSWSRRMARGVDELLSDDEIIAIIEDMARGIVPQAPEAL